mmetsp:Transcript_38976/g.70352  ORF Transcript_38976/g.70352 Transcript_38976/m.70352 type:complete len:153 (-) Transcript_38976:492-950(-)
MGAQGGLVGGDTGGAFDLTGACAPGGAEGGAGGGPDGGAEGGELTKAGGADGTGVLGMAGLEASDRLCSGRTSSELGSPQVDHGQLLAHQASSKSIGSAGSAYLRTGGLVSTKDDGSGELPMDLGFSGEVDVEEAPLAAAAATRCFALASLS